MKGPARIPLSRRYFLQLTGSAAAAVSIVPGHVLGANGQTPPSNRLNIASIGAGGMAAGDIDAVARNNNIVALCEVDPARGQASFQKHTNAKRFEDFRKMFDAMEKQIDAVIVATPDHTHAVASLAAIKRKKHLYCEKPLAHSIHEVRTLMKAAKEHNVITQLGNQGHSFDSIRTFCEMIWDGAIGKVHTIHAGCRAVNSGIDQLDNVKTERPAVPPGLNWDLWLGPAQYRPYHPAYMPGRWRGWVPFGNGTVGDWTCHVVDPLFWAFDLGAPSSIQAEVPDWDPVKQADAYPKGEIITYQFAGNTKRGPIELKWHSGTQKIPRPPELDADEKDIETGAVVMGDKGTIVYGSHGATHVRLIPDSKNDAYKRPAQSIPRVREHHADWVDAIKEGRKAGSDFSYGGPLTEIALLGIIAIKHPGQKLNWDGAKGQFTNSKTASALLKPEARKGWEV